jgi:Pep3/Vps18/deep orange family
LRWCNDHFGLRTQTGVYYGTIDRSLSGPAVLSGVLSSSVIVDSGLLPYTTAASQGSGAPVVPVSLALTPHHIVTLSEHFEVRFINRVAQKLVQKERLDPAAALLSSSATSASVGLDESAMGVGEFLMDIRRPDQIWLRKGRLLVHISSSQEDRDVWKYTLQKCLDWPVSDKRGGPNSGAMTTTATPRGELSDEIKAQEALFERAKTMCTNASQKVRPPCKVFWFLACRGYEPPLTVYRIAHIVYALF